MVYKNKQHLRLITFSPMYNFNENNVWARQRNTCEPSRISTLKKYEHIHNLILTYLYIHMLNRFQGYKE